MSRKRKTPSPSSIFFDDHSVHSAISQTEDALSSCNKPKLETAIVYCEGCFGQAEGKIANDLVRESEQYDILSVIDSERSGEDSGEILGGEANKIPVYQSLGEALAQAGRAPNYFIFGVTPAAGELSETERRLLLRVIGYGINVLTELYEVLNLDPEFVDACSKKNVVINEVTSEL